MSGLVCALFAPWIALITLVGSVRKILLAIVVLDIPLQMDTNFSHLDGPAEFGALGGFNVSVTTLALPGLYAAWLVDCLARRGRPAFPPFRLILPLASYLVFAVLSLFAAYDLDLSFRELFLLLQMFLLYVYLVGSVRTWQDVRFVVMLLLCGLVLESLIMIGLSRTGGYFEVAGIIGRVYTPPDGIDGGARVAGTVGSPNEAAAYLSTLMAPAVGLLLTSLGRPYKVLAVLGLSLGAVALIGTQSRGGWLAAALSVTIVCASLWRRGRLSLTVPLILLGLVSALALVFHDRIIERLTGDDRGSAQSRLPLMVMAFEIIGENPVLGIGANNYTAALERRASTFSDDFLYTVHNKYLLVWAETGIGGLAAFLWFLIATIRRGWERGKHADALLSPLALGFTAALVGHMVHMNVDLFSGRSQVQLLWLIAGLVGVMSLVEVPRPSRS